MNPFLWVAVILKPDTVLDLKAGFVLGSSGHSLSSLCDKHKCYRSNLKGRPALKTVITSSKEPGNHSSLKEDRVP